MAQTSTEQRELGLVDKVDFRILNVANNEKKLTELLGKFLAPLLLKLTSEHESVRTQVITIAQRLKTFIQPPDVVLPVAALLNQFQSTNSEALKLVDAGFIAHSIGRIKPKERAALLPAALSGFSKARPEATSTGHLLDTILRTLPDLKIPPRGSKEDDEFRKEIGFSDGADASAVSGWFGKFLVLNPASRDDSRILNSSEVQQLIMDIPGKTWGPGGASLSTTRKCVVNFLASGAFTDEDRFIPALYAACHTDSRVSSVGEEMLKRSAVNLESEALVSELVTIHSRLPVRHRIRILNILSRSVRAATVPEIPLIVELNLRTDYISALEQTKLLNALFEYVNWVARNGGARPNTVGEPLTDQMRRYITDQGWPIPEVDKNDALELRARAYETIGIIGKGETVSNTARMELMSWLFRSLAEDPTHTAVVSIDGALSSLTSMFPPRPDLGIQLPLTAILMTYMTAEEGEGDIIRSTRHAVTKWANNCLPFSNPTARWIDILAAAGRRDERSEVVEEGKKGLDPWTYYSHDAASSDLPDWQKLVYAFFKEPMSHMNTKEWRVGRDMDVDVLSTFFNFPGDKINAYPVAVRYCQQMLFLKALKDFKVEPGWERQMTALVSTDKDSRAAIRNYLAGCETSDLADLLDAAFEGMLRDKVSIVEGCCRSFVELASLSPKHVVATLAPRAQELLPLVKSNRKEVRVLAAKALGILGPHPSNSSESINQLKNSLSALSGSWKTAVGSELNAAEGAFLALGHLLSRAVYYDPKTALLHLDDVSDLFLSAKEIADAPPSVQEAVYEAVTQLWTAGIPTVSASSASKELVGIEAFIDIIKEEAKKSNEKAITALGRITIPFDRLLSHQADGKELSAKFIANALEKLYSLHEIKQVEVHFAIGEAITSTIALWDSEVVELSLDVDSEDTSYQVGRRSGLITETVGKILTDCKATKPALLKASGIWLFCIIKHCSHLPEIQEKLRECQVAFMRLLSARDELVQETASRGLALVYEKGDESLKGDLVRDLVSSFTGTGPQLKVDEDTELFDAGVLPTGEGKSITSYKDIVSLANEVGDQSLVYKFMSLATNAATWSTRSAFGRFGLSNILSESEVDPKLYPKLYRYRFDPNQNVRKSMDDIWKALVKDSNEVIETHFDAIMVDLLKSILGKEWRVRQASCDAIADLVQGRPFTQYEKYYQDVWMHALKVLDDVKTSVRQAALTLCIGLSKTLVRQLEENGSGASAIAMMKEALPFLMSEKGIESGVEEVQIVATITVLKIAKHGGNALKPYIAGMVVHLLGLLGTIEHQGVNYAYLRSSAADREKIDKLRSSAVNQSPISEAIENCLRNVDGDVMAELAPGLEGAIKSAIALPTKFGCSRVVSTLAARHQEAFTPYSARFLQLMQKQALDRNDEASSSYARAAAYIIRVAPDEAKQKFARHFIDLYFSSEDETRRQKVADIILALSKISPDHFNALESELLPFAYFASHDTDEYVQEELEEVWNKHAGSALSIARYVPEIVGLVSRGLNTPQWALKHAAALTTAALTKAVAGASDVSGAVNEGNMRAVWPVLDQCLALKTFPGKEKLLDAFPDFVAKGKPLWSADAKLAAQLTKIALREAKRNNEAYRVHAFKCLWRFAGAREDVDLLDEIQAIVTPFMDELADGDPMDVDDKGAGKEDRTRETAAAALEAVARGFSPAKMKTEPGAVLGRVFGVLKPYLASGEFAGVRREVWYKCVLDMVPKTGPATEGAAGAKTAELALAYFASLDMEKPDVGTEDQRSTRAKAAAAVVRGLKNGVFGGAGGDEGEAAIAEMKAVLEKALKGERSLDVQKLLKAALAEV